MTKSPEAANCICGGPASVFGRAGGYSHSFVRCWNHWCWIGPNARTRQAAILAWNEVMLAAKQKGVK